MYKLPLVMFIAGIIFFLLSETLPISYTGMMISGGLLIFASIIISFVTYLTPKY